MIRRLGLSLLALLLVGLLCAGGWLFGTSSGAKVAIAYVSGILPNVKLRHADGPLVGPLTLRTIDLRLGQTRLQVDHLYLDWSPACLLVAEVCLREVRAQQVQLTLAAPAAAPPATTRRRLPTVQVPLAIGIGKLDIGKLDIVRGPLALHFSDIASELSWDDDGMRIARLALSMPAWTARLRGTLHTRGDWPLEAMLDFRMPRAGNGEPVFSLQGSAGGTLLDTELDLATSGLVEAGIAGTLQTLEPGLPFQATATAGRIRIPPGASDDKATWLQQVDLAANGKLVTGFNLTGQALVDTPWAPPLPARADLKATWRGIDGGELHFTDPRLAASLATDWRWLGGQHFRIDARVRHLDLSLFNRALTSSLAGRVAIRGELGGGRSDVLVDVGTLAGTLGPRPVAARGPLRWQQDHWRFSSFQLAQERNRAQLDGTLGDHWDVAAQLVLEDLHTLLPAFAGSAIGNATISGTPTDPRFAFALAGSDVLLPAVTLPAPVARSVRLPPAAWSVSGRGSLQHADIDDARTAADAPFTVTGRGSVDWRDGLRWDLDTLLSEFPLRHLAREFGGRVSGSFATRGVLGDTLQDLAVTTRLDGQLEQRPLRISADLGYTPGNIEVTSLYLHHGHNRMLASGRLNDDEMRLELDASAPELADSFRGLSGSIEADARIAGKPDTANGTLQLEARHLKYGVLAASTISGSMELAAGGHAPSRLALDAGGVKAGNDTVDAAIVIQGTRQEHRIGLKLDQAPLALAIDAGGRWAGNAWDGALAAGSLQWRQWRWDAVGNPALAVRGRQLHVAPHCWIDGKARACITAPAVIGHSGELQGEAFHLPPGLLLGDLLPLDTGISGTIGGTVAGRWTTGMPDNLAIDIRNGTPLVLAETTDDGSQRPVATIDEVLALARIDAQGTHASARIGGSTLGTLEAEADVSLRDRALAGRIQVHDFNIALANAFAYQVHEIGGKVDADLTLGGTLATPRVGGAASLREGHASLVRAPLSIERVTLDSQFDGRQMELAGSFRTPESRQDVVIDGRFALQGNSWHGEATARGKEMVIALPPQYQFTTAPDLRLRLDDRRVRVSGTVAVPSGRIEMKSLPTQSVARSRDVILVHEEGEVETRRTLFERNADVGFTLGDDIRFKAFGADGNLAGNLRVRSRPDIPLLVDGELHVVDGKYAAFGQSLTLRQADIIFNGPPDQPLVDATAFRTIDDPGVKEVGLRLTGSLRKPETTLWSTPELPQEEALSWLITGQPRTATNGDTLSGEAAQAALSLGVAQGSALLNQAGQQLGLTEFQLTAGGDGDDTEVQVGTSLNERIYVGYNRRVFSGEESLLLRLHMTRRLMLEAVSGIESALDLFYTFEF